MTKKLWLLILAGMLALCGRDASRAEVDQKNANYSDAWVDLIASKPLRMQRAYNSRTLFIGIFGFGWCSNFEHTLASASADVMLFTFCGAGDELSFRRVTTDLFASPKYGTVRRAGDRLVVSLTPEAALDSGMAGCDECRQYQLEGQVSTFDLRGRLLETRYSSGGRLTFEYAADLLRAVHDGDGHRFTLEYYSNGCVRRVFATNGLEARYYYDLERNLIMAVNSLHKKYSYIYDYVHNLVREEFPDGRTKVLTYYVPYDWVVSRKGLDGTLEQYNYLPRSQHHFRVDVIRTRGAQVERDRSEFFYRGSLRRSVETFGDNLRDVIWDSNGSPESVTLNGLRRRYKFDARGRLIDSATRLENLQIPGLRVQEVKRPSR